MITEHQLEILRWKSRGKTDQETADLMGVASQTVTNILVDARTANGVPSTLMLVVRAYELGLFFPVVMEMVRRRAGNVSCIDA